MLAALLAGRPDEFLERRAELLERGRLDRSIVARLEAAVAAEPAAFRFDGDGAATLSAEGHSFAAGRFEVPSIRALKERARKDATGTHRARLFALLGGDPSTDIGALQATASPGSLFQVASQFNCLEAPDAMVVPVERYFRDPTQGPRASISTFPGTLLRHYAAPAGDGTRFTQTEARQLNLLEAALPASVARVFSGYLMTQHIPDLGSAIRAAESNFDSICVGVHDELDVVYGMNWDGEVRDAPRIAQVFTSTLAIGYSDGLTDALGATKLSRVLLRGAYLGTLLAAASLRKSTAVLTLIGGGVFGNAHHVIWEAIEWALEQTDPLLGGPLDVVVNCRDIDAGVRPDVLRATSARGGRAFRLDMGEVHEL